LIGIANLVDRVCGDRSLLNGLCYLDLLSAFFRLLDQINSQFRCRATGKKQQKKSKLQVTELAIV
jgi:hypothetical protein